MKKIRITEIAREVFMMRGFDERGCYSYPCDDMCCIGGVEVDREAFDLMLRHRNLIEDSLGVALEDCFRRKWSNDSDFPGGNSIDSSVGRNDYCMFHMPEGKGCVLYKLGAEKNIPRRIIPAICRLYPLTWGNGVLCISEHLEPTCNCFARDNTTRKSLLKTQKEEIDDIFKIEEALLSRKA